MKTLYNIYRPKTYDQIKGQEIVKKILINNTLKNEIHHSYIFHGNRGVGKTTIARIFAKSLNCQNKENENPCNSCDSCKAIDNNASINVIEIDAASNNGVDEVRKLVENSNYSIGSNNYKIYIIDEVHMFSKAAFNALLKLLEEPPKNIVFLLLTTEIIKIPETIISRSMILNFKNINLSNIHEYLEEILLKEEITFENEALNNICLLSSGSLRDAISILQLVISYKNEVTLSILYEVLDIPDENLINSLIEGNWKEFIDIYSKKEINSKLTIKIIIEKLVKLSISNNKNDIYQKILNELVNVVLFIKDNYLLKVSLFQIFRKNFSIVSHETSTIANNNNNNELMNETTENIDNTDITMENNVSHETVNNDSSSESSNLENDLPDTSSEMKDYDINNTIIDDIEDKNDLFEVNNTINEPSSEIESEHLSEITNDSIANEPDNQDVQNKSTNNVSHETIGNLLENTKFITDFLNPRNYLCAIINKDSEKTSAAKSRMLYLHNFIGNNDFQKYIPILVESKILSLYNEMLIIGFEDEIMYNEFKKISLDENLFILFEKLIGYNIIPMPVDQNNWKKLISLAKKTTESTVKIYDNSSFELKFKDFYKKIQNELHIGKLIFGDAFVG